MLEINANIRSYELTRADVISKKLFLIINNCAETTVLYVQPVTEIVLQRRLWGGKLFGRSQQFFRGLWVLWGRLRSPRGDSKNTKFDKYWRNY